MFNPIGNFAAPQPLTLIATALPNAIALRVPADNVPPSVSSPEIGNNARGNRAYSPKQQTAQNFILPVSDENSAPASNDNVAKYTSNAQTAFLAQLAAGDPSPEVSGIFLQYEKLLSYANVKYKPSNAGKPVDPVGIFKTLLQIESELPEEINLDESKNSVVEQVSTVADSTPTENVAASEPTLPQTQPQSQIIKYQETTARNNNYEPKNLEVA